MTFLYYSYVRVPLGELKYCYFENKLDGIGSMSLGDELRLVDSES